MATGSILFSLLGLRMASCSYNYICISVIANGGAHVVFLQSFKSSLMAFRHLGIERNVVMNMC